MSCNPRSSHPTCQSERPSPVSRLFASFLLDDYFIGNPLEITDEYQIIRVTSSHEHLGDIAT